MRAHALLVCLLAITPSYARPVVPTKCQCAFSKISLEKLQLLLDRHHHDDPDSFDNSHQTTYPTGTSPSVPESVLELDRPLSTQILMDLSLPRASAPTSRPAKSENSELDAEEIYRCLEEVTRAQQEQRRSDGSMVIGMVMLFVVAVLLVELVEKLVRIRREWRYQTGVIALPDPSRRNHCRSPPPPVIWVADEDKKRIQLL